MSNNTSLTFSKQLRFHRLEIFEGGTWKILASVPAGEMTFTEEVTHEESSLMGQTAEIEGDRRVIGTVASLTATVNMFDSGTFERLMPAASESLIGGLPAASGSQWRSQATITKPVYLDGVRAVGDMDDGMVVAEPVFGKCRVTRGAVTIRGPEVSGQECTFTAVQSANDATGSLRNVRLWKRVEYPSSTQYLATLGTL